MNRYQWKYPSEGLRHPRTMAEAFGPYAQLHVERQGQWKTPAMYAIAAILALFAIAVAAA